MRNAKTYPGIHKDRSGGMTTVGTIIRDAWVFDILPEDETCEGWTYDRIDAIYDKVTEAWKPYGHLASRLPADASKDMPTRYTRETFFRPEEVERQDWSIAADVYNRCQLLLSRSETGCVFVPIRNMQYVGVIDAEEIIFVDSQGGYAHKDGHGGRPIVLAWQPDRRDRGSLTDAVPCHVIYYGSGLKDTQRQLVGEFAAALRQLEQKYRDAAIPACGAQILPLKQAKTD